MSRNIYIPINFFLTQISTIHEVFQFSKSYIKQEYCHNENSLRYNNAFMQLHCVF